jgi:acyl transferase domain-containing protein
MTERRDLLKQSLAAIERLQARLSASERAAHAPIAIVGAGCRFAGGVEDPQSLWRLVHNGVDAVGEVPADRWDADAYYDADPKAPGKMVTKRGGFLTQVDRFDPQFFGISPREAASLDPQQRLLMETAYEALENAAIAPDGLARSATGVFIGITMSDYGQLMRTGGLADTDVYSATGSALNAAAGRLSFNFGLQGPCVAVDTACSSSLVAVHLACQSLRSGESEMALAGGVNVILSPDAMVLFSKWGMMAPDGICKTFDASADGFVRAEGCAVIALKRLSDAVEAGDPILAVIRGSAVNSDGRSSGLTVPNGLAQQAVLRSALASAELQPADIDYVEAHGTGTPLGDPIEIEALGAVMCEGRALRRPLLIGSIKTNIGHAEAASGVAGLLKVVMSLHHEAIPPHLHLNAPNPRIPWTSYPVVVPTTLSPWPRSERLRRAGVSSFGFSGTNAHVVIEEAPVRAVAKRSAHEANTGPRIVTVSARTEAALRDSASRLNAVFDGTDAPTLADVATTLATGRTHHAHRVAFLCDSSDELRLALSAIQVGEAPARGARGVVRDGELRKIGFVFTGQGSQYPGMGRALYDREPVFREVLDRAAGALAGKLTLPLLDVMFGRADCGAALAETSYTQPALFALEFALAELWRSWGVVPTIVAGHSIGEYVAACVAGVFSFEDGIALVAERGRLMQALPAGGAMAAVFCSQASVARHVAERADCLAIAGLNGPEETVLSGEAKVLDEVLGLLAAEGIGARQLEVSHAFHSPLLKPMLSGLEARSRTIVHQAPCIPLVSNVSGAVFAMDNGPNALYWAQHAREPVNFAGCLETMSAARVTTLIEVGPHPTLLGLAARARPSASWTTVSSLRRNRDDFHELLTSLSAVYAQGANVRWGAVGAVIGGRRVALPTYPFQRERYWLDATTGKETRAARDGHPLLGERRELSNAPGTYFWEQELSLVTHPWMSDHRVDGTAIVPASAYVEMAFAAGREVMAGGSLAIQNIENLKPMILHETQKRLVQVIISITVDEGAKFQVHSRAIGGVGRQNVEWILHARAGLALEDSVEQLPGSQIIDAARTRCVNEIGGASFYEMLAKSGNQWGPSFRGVRTLWLASDESVGRIEIPASLGVETSRYLIHPALGDACGHPLVAIISRNEPTVAFVGVGVEKIRLHGRISTSPIWLHAKIRKEAGTDHTRVGDVRVYDNTGILLCEILGAKLHLLDQNTSNALMGVPRDWYYQPKWSLKATSSKGPRATGAGSWLVFADRSGLGAAIAKLRETNGQNTILVTSGKEWSRNGDAITIRPDNEADYRRLIRAANHPRAVLYLWSVEAWSDQSVEDSLTADAERVLLLLKGVLVDDAAHRPRVWFVTSGAQKVVSSDGCDTPAHATLWGLCRGLSAEHPDLWGGLVDVDIASGSLDMAIVGEVLNGDVEDKLAFRQGKRYVPRLERRGVEKDAGVDFVPRSNVAYLITGGLGGLGLAIARWLVERGARHLLLLGRTPLPPQENWGSLGSDAGGTRVKSILALRELGATVEIASIDVAVRDELARLLRERAKANLPDVGGIVHAAGVSQIEALASQDIQSLRAGTSAKTLGAWHLHRHFEHKELDCFIMCSSGAALFNAPLFGAYAAGNAFLDALAEHRRARGMTALSVNWGAWGEVGMAIEMYRDSRSVRVAGFGAISTSHGLEALTELLKSGDTQTAVMPINWNEVVRAYPAMASDRFLSNFFSVSSGAEAEGILTNLSLDMLLAVAPEQRRDPVIKYLHMCAAGLLGTTVGQFGSAAPLASLGFDSLMAVQLKNRIEIDLLVAIPIVEILQGLSVDQLASSVVNAIDVLKPELIESRVNKVEIVWEEGTL